MGRSSNDCVASSNVFRDVFRSDEAIHGNKSGRNADRQNAIERPRAAKNILRRNILEGPSKKSTEVSPLRLSVEEYMFFAGRKPVCRKERSRLAVDEFLLCTCPAKNMLSLGMELDV